MISPISRIILRYGAGALVSYGVLSTDWGKTLAGDADALKLVELVVGFGTAVATEWWYWLANKLGWTK
jgi:hypothetical protein